MKCCLRQSKKNADDSQLISQAKAVIRDNLESRYTSASVLNILEISCALDPRFRSLPYHDDANRNRIYEDIIELIQTTDKQVIIKQEPGVEPAGQAGQPTLPALSDEPTPGSSTAEDSSPSTSPKRKRSAMEDLFGDVFVVKTEAGKPLSVLAKEEVIRYRAEPCLQFNSNPLLWWKDNQYLYPHLAKLARSYLCIQGTSVPSERVFSTAGEVVTAKRSALSPDLVDMLIFLKKNCDL